LCNQDIEVVYFFIVVRMTEVQDSCNMQVRNNMFGREFLWTDVARKTLYYIYIYLFTAIGLLPGGSNDTISLCVNHF